MVYALVTGDKIGETVEVKKKRKMSPRKTRLLIREVETRDLMRALGHLVVDRMGPFPKTIKGIAVDSRRVAPGFLFVAIKGSERSGAEFVEHAVQNGACCVMIEDGCAVSQQIPAIVVRDARLASGMAASLFYGNPTSEVPVVAVTGTNGKTTFTYLMEAIMREAGLNPGVIGTVDYRLADKRWPSGLTTPDPVTLQRTIREMIVEGADSIVMEASSHALEQRRLWGSKIKCAVFTNMTRDHLDYHKTMDNYFLAKQRLFLDYTPEISAFNIDDPYGHILYLRARGKKITYSLEHDATIRPKEMVVDINGIDIVLDLYGKTINVSSRLLGRFNVYNILAAISAALCLGIPSSAIQKGIYQCHAIPGRMERVVPDSSIYAFVDYAHTPDAVERVLREIRGLLASRVITVVGCGGDRDRGKRPLIGYIATRLSDLTIFTSDNPRSEDPLRIIGDMLDGVEGHGAPIQLPRLSVYPKREYKVVVNREEAIRLAVEQAKPGDVILVLGKGHEQYQFINGKKKYFDDRKILKEALEDSTLC